MVRTHEHRNWQARAYKRVRACQAAVLVRAHQDTSMNIFVLACHAKAAANLHCDRHVCKMIIETAQMLYTYLDSIGELARIDLKNPFTGDALTPYKPTHKHHPCVLWLHGGRSHFRWLVSLGMHLCDRYSAIYDKTHKTAEHLFALDAWVCPERLPNDCQPTEWLQRLEAHGVSRDVLAACAAKVCLADPPEGCHFGVACMSDETVPLEVDEQGHASTVQSYRSLMRHKQAVDFRMTWAKDDEPPAALVEWVS